MVVAKSIPRTQRQSIFLKGESRRGDRTIFRHQIFLRNSFAKHVIQGLEHDDSKRRIKSLSMLIEESHKDAASPCSPFHSRLIASSF